MTRNDIARFNPLIGMNTADTLENLNICLTRLGETFATRHDDASIAFFCCSVAAALAYESEQIKDQPIKPPIRRADPVRLAASS